MMEPTTLLLAVAVCLVVLLLFRRDPEKMRIKEMMDKVPGPPSYPILGTMLPYIFLPPEGRWDLFFNLMMKYKPLFKGWLGPFPGICTSHPDYVEALLNNAKMIDKALPYKFLHPWLGTGLLTSTGTKWHSHRKLITPSFHFKILENFVPIFAKNCDILVNKLKKEVGGEVFDIYPYISACALDIICESAMGACVNAQKYENSDYVTAVNEMKAILSERLAKPLLAFDFIFNFTKWSKLQKKSLEIIDGFTKKLASFAKTLLNLNFLFFFRVIRERKQQRLKNIREHFPEDDEYFGQKKRIAFLDMLLDASEDGNKLTDEEIQEEVDTFMFGGHDTIAAAISTSLYLLGLHPEIQDRVHEELEGIFKDSDHSPTLKDLKNMKYLHMVIKEALRLYPSVPLLARMLTQDLQLGSHTIPAGVTACVPIFAMHRDPDIFPSPTQFDPDNFLPEKVVNRHPYAYIPFSAGPRNCIGQKFAMLEVKMVLSSILRRYEVRSADKSEDLVLLLEIIFRSKNGFRITLTPRGRGKDK
ncbi:cytochrome P450 4C1-like [Periplaneta americana]|uniref:cytochrome P450 4C1-like n=1 Tax=Periplaneta americana TaxID=6978 RepID=UPI0037E9BE42